MGTNCYRRGYESGPWYELKAIRAAIDYKIAKGIDNNRERELYASWLKSPEYQKADKENMARGFYQPLSLQGEVQGDIPKVAGYITTVQNVSPARIGSLGIMLHPGRPPKAENEPVSRMTLWRRQQKQSQAALL